MLSIIIFNNQRLTMLHCPCCWFQKARAVSPCGSLRRLSEHVCLFDFEIYSTAMITTTTSIGIVLLVVRMELPAHEGLRRLKGTDPWQCPWAGTPTNSIGVVVRD